MTPAGAEIELWQQTVRVMLAPPQGRTSARWRADVERSVLALTGSDGCTAHVPGPGAEVAARRQEREDETPEDGPDAEVRPGLPTDRSTFLRKADVAAADVRTPITMTVRLAANTRGWLTVFRSTEPEPGYVERTTELLESVLPAFRSGLRARWSRALGRTGMARTMNVLGRTALVCDESGRMLLATDALLELEDTAAEGARIRGEMERTARDLARARSRGESTDKLDREVGTEPPYRLHGQVLERTGLPGSPPLVVVFAEPAPAPPPETRWRSRFGLTDREIEVVDLVAKGESNRAIAEVLEISPYTVQHHVRSALAKLEVKSRAAVAARLREAQCGKD